MDFNLPAKIFRRIITLLFLSIFTATSPRAEETREIYINKFLIDLYLLYKFPINKNLLLGNLEIYKPQVAFSESDQLLYLNTNYKIEINKKSAEGAISFRTYPVFNLVNQSITIHKTTIDGINFSELSMSKDTLNLLNLVLIKSIEGMPIYKFDNTTSVPKEIKIYGNGILLKY